MELFLNTENHFTMNDISVMKALNAIRFIDDEQFTHDIGELVRSLWDANYLSYTIPDAESIFVFSPENIDRDDVMYVAKEVSEAEYVSSDAEFSEMLNHILKYLIRHGIIEQVQTE